MAKTIRITLTGEAQDLVEQLKKQGLMAQESQLAQVDRQGQITGSLRVQ